MGIRMQDLASTDFSDVIARPRKRLTVTHPGQFLQNEFMEPHGLSANALATALHVPANRITAILKGQRAVTADTALRLGRLLSSRLSHRQSLTVICDGRRAISRIALPGGRMLEGDAKWYGQGAKIAALRYH